MIYILFFFVKQKTAYEMRISDWSSDVCSSDLAGPQYRNDSYFFSGQLLDIQGAGPALDAGWLQRQIFRCFVSQQSGDRSEERRVGKECVSTCRSRWSLHY